MRIAVVIPTLRRPESLERAIRSIWLQTHLDGVEIVVADNDPTGSARSIAEGLAAQGPCPLIYAHAPQPGVATARNVGLAATTAPMIAFLDDDEEASAGWLQALIKAQAATGADVVFGPIRGRVPEGTGWTTPYLERFFGRAGPAEDGQIPTPFGCGNSLMVRATALPGTAPFDTAADQAGGEDDVLFAALTERGGRFGWAADAWVDEHAPAHRATLKYALARAFAYGQGPSQTAAAARNWVAVARWMAIGTAQAILWGTASAGLFLTQAPRRAEMFDRTARGIGKVLWFKGLEPHFYGQREVDRLDRAAS
ncbi:glycosyltransferase [Rhizobium sp. CRIBSB]|nr:glycosyltransferase [Rhizobium sp. CRIBSB]